MRNLLKALPELISAALLLALWVEPRRFDIGWFRSGVLTLLLEFFVINASGFMAVLMYDPHTQAAKRSLQVAGLGAFYLVAGDPAARGPGDRVITDDWTRQPDPLPDSGTVAR